MRIRMLPELSFPFPGAVLAVLLGMTAGIALPCAAAAHQHVGSAPPHASARRAPLPAWRVVGGGPVSAGGVLCTQVRVSPGGVPHLAYQDFTLPAHRVAVRRFTAGAWTPLTLAGSGSVSEGWYNRMAFQHDGALVLATRDYGLAGQLGVRRCAQPGAPWLPLGGGGVSPSDAHYTDVAVLPDGRIAVAFQDRATTPVDRTSVVVWDEVGWRIVSGSGLSAGTSAFSSLAVAVDGTLLAAFTDWNLAGKATVLAWREAQDRWEPLGAPGFTPDTPNNLILRVAPDGTPYVAYYVWSTRIVVRRFDGTAWPAVGLEVDGEDVPVVETEGWRQWLGMEIDAAGRPVVAYQAANRGRRAVVKRFDPPSQVWVAIGEPGFTPGAADYLSLALGPDGTPFVAFRDGGTGRALVMSWR